jgi:hypothetical protein
MRFSTLVVLLSGLLLAGCSQFSAGSVYSPASGNMWHYGYSETQLSPDTFRVTFRGYGIAQAKAYDFALLRAVDLCRANGFTHFAIPTENGTTGNGPGMILPAGNAAIFASVEQPEVSLTVKFGKEAPGSFDAAFLQQSLKKKHNIKD